MNKNNTLHLVRESNGVYILTMETAENRFNPGFIKDLHEALDTIEKSQGPAALVIANKGKIWSNGLDLDWLGQNVSQSTELLNSYMKLIGRLLTFPVPTIAAINGHAFAAGFMMALACDYRIMRKDRGFLCLPEVDLHMPLTPGMAAIIKCKITEPNVLRDAILLGKRFTADESAKLRIIDASVEEKAVLQKSLELAAAISSKGEDRKTMNDLKAETYKETYKVLIDGGLGRASETFRKSKL